MDVNKCLTNGYPNKFIEKYGKSKDKTPKEATVDKKTYYYST